MADQGDTPEQTENAELRRELAQRDEEILRLRDLLIGRDTELGAALGRLEILEQRSQRIKEAAGRVPIPGVGGFVDRLLIWLQGRRG